MRQGIQLKYARVVIYPIAERNSFGGAYNHATVDLYKRKGTDGGEGFLFSFKFQRHDIAAEAASRGNIFERAEDLDPRFDYGPYRLSAFYAGKLDLEAKLDYSFEAIPKLRAAERLLQRIFKIRNDGTVKSVRDELATLLAQLEYIGLEVEIVYKNRGTTVKLEERTQVGTGKAWLEARGYTRAKDQEAYEARKKADEAAKASAEVQP